MIILRKLLLIYLLFLSLNNNAYSQGNWINQPSPTSKYLNKVFFINNNTGWICGDSGIIMNTTNKGVNWNIQNTNIFSNIVNIFFLNENQGWALAWEVAPDSNSYLGTIMLKTSDGGLNWQNSMFADQNRFLKTIYFLNSLTGYAGGSPGGIFKTVDGGNRWNLTGVDTSSLVILPVEDIDFLNADTGYACGGFRDFAGSMWKTTDGGDLWNVSIVGPEPVNDLYIYNSKNVISVGGDFEYGSSYVKTTNAGLNWIYDTLGVFGVARSIDYRTPYEAWISVGEKFSLTTDTGNTFTSFYTTDSSRMEDLCFTDSLNGWAVGYKGVILKYIYSSTSANNNSESFNPTDFILFQNYPNPFNPTTKINYELRVTNYVSVIVYDILGNEVGSLVNQKQNAGRYEVEFDGSNIASGIYFYTLNVGSIPGKSDFTQTKKMILLK